MPAMQATPDVSDAANHRGGLPADLGRVLETADAADVEALFAQLEAVLRQPSSHEAETVTNSVRALNPAPGAPAAATRAPAPVRRHRVRDAVSFVGLRAVLPIGVVVAAVLGLLALVG